MLVTVKENNPPGTLFVAKQAFAIYSQKMVSENSCETHLKLLRKPIS